MTSHARRRAIVLTAGMGAAALLGSFAQPTRRADSLPALDLEQVFPKAFGDWQVDLAAAAFVRPAGELSQQLYQQLLERTYVDRLGRRVMLSVAYGSEQAAGLELHWPEVCYRYGGFTVSGRHVAQILVDGRLLPVTRLIATMPMRPEPVTYWAVLGDERTADANTFRLRRLGYAVRRQIADGLLVRVSSIDPVGERAFTLHEEFIDELVRALEPDERARVEGEPTEG